MEGKVVALQVRSREGKGHLPAVQMLLVKGEGIAGEKVRKGKTVVSLFIQQEQGEQIKKRGLCSSRFWENITLVGLAAEMVQVGTKLFLGKAVIQVTEKKHCFPECELAVGRADCALRSQAMFAEVIRSGEVMTGDPCGLIDPEE